MSRPVETITDARGRVIEVRGLGVWEQIDMRECIRDGLKNDPFVAQMATFAAMVRTIDGVPFPFPKTEADFRRTVEKLDDDGWAAIQTWLERKATAAKQAANQAQRDSTVPLEPSAESLTHPD